MQPSRRSGRVTAVSAILVVSSVAFACVAGAQSTGVPDTAARRRTADTAHVLAPVVVKAEAAKFDGRSLAERMRQQDAEIGRLQTRLTYLKTTVTDSIQRAITSADSVTANLRARRLALEARLAELEARTVTPPSSAPPPGGAR